MNQAILGLAFTYVALAALVLTIFLRTRIPAWIKLLCVILVSGFYYMTYHSLQGLLGWPTQQEIPENFQLLASSITEPDETTGEDGRIHIWVNPFIDNKPAPEPRAYDLPYDLELHSSLEAALKKQRRGKVQLGRSKKMATNDEETPRNLTRYGQKRQLLEFYDLPVPELPEK
ncbi:MAG: hypothetical protein MI865_07360 [Proteobacteria bacterium]|nr:hypothetical protein [Pseudomonadota bacterium]